MVNLDNKTIQKYKAFTDWTDTLEALNERQWQSPIAVGKVGPAEIISHLLNWDHYLITVIFPAIQNGMGMEFPDFDSFNKGAYEYAKSGISKQQLLHEFKQTRHLLADTLLAEPDVAIKHVPANGVTNCPHTGTPYSLLYIIHEFNEHDEHHRNQILSVIK